MVVSGSSAKVLLPQVPEALMLQKITQQALKEGSFPIPLTTRTRSPYIQSSSLKALSNFSSNFAEWVEETQLSAFPSSISF